MSDPSADELDSETVAQVSRGSGAGAPCQPPVAAADELDSETVAQVSRVSGAGAPSESRRAGTPEEQSPSVQKLLDALRVGDVGAREQILVRYEPWLKLLTRLQIDSRFQGKFSESDIVQQTLLDAYRNLPEFRGHHEAQLLAWLRQILAHVLSHEIRRYRGTEQRDVDREVSLEAALAESSQRLANVLADSGPSPSAHAAAHEQELLLADVLAKLPDDYREVIILRNLAGLSHEEIANRMGRSVGAVRMLWVRALAALRPALASE